MNGLSNVHVCANMLPADYLDTVYMYVPNNLQTFRTIYRMTNVVIKLKKQTGCQACNGKTETENKFWFEEEEEEILQPYFL